MTFKILPKSYLIEPNTYLPILWPFSYTFGHAYSPLKSAKLRFSSEVTLMNLVRILKGIGNALFETTKDPTTCAYINFFEISSQCLSRSCELGFMLNSSDVFTNFL